uniref:Aminoglycoside 6-adenylyltransferase n=1 Tax=Steinernema glaseri TaxID=37863 RepID=A0A1I8AJ86_9BILA
MSLFPADRNAHRENMEFARSVNRWRRTLFLPSGIVDETFRKLVVELGWKRVLDQCVNNGHTWTAGANWIDVRYGKWVLIQAAVKNYLKGEGPNDQQQIRFMEELSDFMLQNRILDPWNGRPQTVGMLTPVDLYNLTRQYVLSDALDLFNALWAQEDMNNAVVRENAFNRIVEAIRRRMP